MSKETIVSIAERTGFSVSTVSRVLSGNGKKYKISDSTVKVITEEAEQCGYTPSLLAKGLRMKKTNTIGLLIPSIENSFFANMASIVIRETKSRGYTSILIDSRETEENEREGLYSLISRNVDGIIVASSSPVPDYLEQLNKTSTPIVLIDRHFEATSLPYVCTNNYQGSYEATRYLLEQGHQNILCLQGVPYSMPSKERVRGYRQALTEAGLANEALVAGNEFSIQNGYLETKLALNRPERFSAIFALSNTILLGAIKALRESNLSIPEDVSLISFDNDTYLDYLNPPITRVCQPIEEIAVTAIKVLVSKLEKDPKAPPSSGDVLQVQLNPNFLIRSSVKNRLK